MLTEYLLIMSSAESEATEYLCRLKGLDFDWNELRHESNDAIIKMSSAKLQRICRNLSVFGKTINIVCKPTEKQVLFFTRGEIGNGCAHIFPSLCNDDPNSETTIEIKIAISVSFSLKNLTQITKASSVSPQVILRLYGEGLLGKTDKSSMASVDSTLLIDIWFNYTSDTTYT